MKNQNRRKKKLIILVEDDKLLANLISVKLLESGYEVETILSGKSAADIIKERKPDLVLLDIMLPVKNGYTILTELHKAGILPGLPVLIISNSGQPVEIDRALRMGVRDYIIKVNFEPNEVAEKVRHLLDQEAGGAAAARNNSAVLFSPKATVLFIEDDVLYTEILQIHFTKANLKLLTAPNVEQARKILAENKINAILLDIILPQIDGFTFLQELKANDQWRQIPVIIASNLGQKEEVNKGFRYGAADYIVKAHNLPSEIVAKVEKIINN